MADLFCDCAKEMSKLFFGLETEKQVTVIWSISFFNSSTRFSLNTLSETNWKWMVGRWVSLWKPYFQVLLLLVLRRVIVSIFPDISRIHSNHRISSYLKTELLAVPEFGLGHQVVALGRRNGFFLRVVFCVLHQKMTWWNDPYHPCMVYLPTFTMQNQPNVGKYIIHGWYGWCCKT